MSIAPETPIITKSQLMRDLAALGIRPAQTIMLHVSVRAIGWIVGGPDMLIHALLDLLTPNGTLMMYIAWEDRTDHWPQWSSALQTAYLAECPPFDPATSRAYRRWSIVTEYLRTWPGAHRSANPGASVVAVGAHAAWITADHPLHYGYGVGTPFAKLCELDGWVLQIGVPRGTLTLIHHAEHLANLPQKRVYRYPAPLLQHGERAWVTIEEYDTSHGIVDGTNGEYMDLLAQEFQQAGYGYHGTVGAASAFLLQANDLRTFAVQWLEQRYT
ncbi:MAG: aminoglycoside 3-N-acetyltransferase [Caldilineaceae bacterium]